MSTECVIYSKLVKNPLKSFVYDFYQLALDRFYHQEKEIASIIKVQAQVRSFVRRKIYLRILRCTIVLQKYKKSKVLKANKQNINYFSFMAIQIQRVFRGYQSRKSVHDFYARKKYLTGLKNKNDQFLKTLCEYDKQQQVEKEYYNLQTAKMEFNRLSSHLHHLTSTACQPGAFNGINTKRKVFDIDLDLLLKVSVKGGIGNKKMQNKCRQIRSMSLQVKN